MTELTTLKKSLLMIQKLKKLLQEQQNQIFEPIAIIGMSCRLPKANNTQEYWQLLLEGQNVISPIPDARWDLLQGSNEAAQRDARLTYPGGYLDHIDQFDAYFFGISPREAMRMDPQQRLLLEVAYDSLEDAGLSLDALAGSHMGVFSSLYASQFSHLQQVDSDLDALLIPTGSAVSIAANRLSYLLDVHGPSMVLDTACSSSLIAVQLACLNLQAKLCDKALVSAVNINLLPSIHATLAKATMLSPTGQCHTFDAKADGYVQGEGVGAIVLKPLSQALKDNDRIYAVIQGSAVNQDGKTNGLTAPNGLQQEHLLRAAYRAANIDPALVSYIECHGTGTFLGDPIEAQALGEVMTKGRTAEQPCWIGSVKTNIGHLEPAAGVVSIIKVALALHKGVIPPHQNYNSPNPHIPFNKYHLRIPQQAEQVPRYGDVAIAGISGFGFGGANAHLVLRELNAVEQQQIAQPQNKEHELFTISAKDPLALAELVQRWITFLDQHSSADLAQLCYNLHLRRTHYAHRLAIVTQSIADLKNKLRDYQKTDAAVFLSDATKKNNKVQHIKEFSSLDSSTLAKHYINQAQIDWVSYETDRSYPLCDLPSYPWQHKRYWPSFAKWQIELSTSNYPMRGRVLSSPLASRQFEFLFDTKVLPEVQDTFYVMHAGYYLEMLAYAVREMGHGQAFNTQNLRFLSPLLVMDGKTVKVHLIIDELQAFRFYSHDGNGHWVEHAQGTLRSTSGARHPELTSGARHPERVFLREGSPESGTAFESSHSMEILRPKRRALDDVLRTQNPDTTDAESFYQRITEMGMPAGSTIRWTEHYSVHEQAILCQLRKEKPEERCTQFVLNMHPGIIDACIQTLFLLLPTEVCKPYIASEMQDIKVYQTTSKPAFIYSELKDLDAEAKQIIGDWYLLDADNQLIASCSNLRLTQLGDGMHISKIMAIESQFNLDFALPYLEQKNQLDLYLTEQFAAIFSMPSSDINIHQSLHDLGMDSLMALAVIRVIESNLAVTYSLPQIMQGPSIHDISEYVLSKQSKEPVIKANKQSLWLANRLMQPKAQVRLFCFPYGGGGASIYREWQREFPADIEVCPIQLPGRENRLDEPAAHDLAELIPILAEQLQPYMDRPFALFGHSFGSLIAFELARYLRKHKMPNASHLFVSAYPDPRQPSNSLNNLLAKLKELNIHLFDLDQQALAQMDDTQLSILATVFKDNGIVDYSDDRINKSIIQVLLPIFVGDMNIVKNYTYYEESALEIPCTVFLGKKDAWVPLSDLQGWTAHSAVSCDFVEFDEGHLFIREPKPRTKVIETIRECLLDLCLVTNDFDKD